MGLVVFSGFAELTVPPTTDREALVAGATRSIVLESPSLLGDDLERALVRAADRGVHVIVVAPARSSPAKDRCGSARATLGGQPPRAMRSVT